MVCVCVCVYLLERLCADWCASARVCLCVCICWYGCVQMCMQVPMYVGAENLYPPLLSETRFLNEPEAVLGHAGQVNEFQGSACGHTLPVLGLKECAEILPPQLMSFCMGSEGRHFTN